MPRLPRHRSIVATVVCAIGLSMLLVTSSLAEESPARAEPAEAWPALALDSPREDLSREKFYFVMTDRFANGSSANDTGGIPGDRTEHGFDPTDEAFYQGGDLAGVRENLDYIENLGTTAIWITPAFVNDPLLGEGENLQAAYHGYWISDFTGIDPHLGSKAEMKALVREAHQRDMKVFFDIVTGYTSDVMGYQEGEYEYRSKGRYPYVDAAGREFDDRDYVDGGAFPELNLGSFPYTPDFPDDDARTARTPDWLNDPTMYHNRGSSTYEGESVEYGDLFGLDDLFTERPEVVRGMVDIYQGWVKETGVDGFRIDTVKHVNMEFWQRFAPALKGYAASLGNDDFFMFGEIYDADPADVAPYTKDGKLSAALDFPFQEAARAYVSQGGPATALRDVFAQDDRYTDTDSNVYSLPTFLGNHDMGRIGSFLLADNPGADDAALLSKDRLAHALLYLSRGQPVVYYGDEQGFTGGEGDRAARQSMFTSRTPAYLDDDLLGTDATHAQDNFDTEHPLYETIAELARLTTDHPALRDGAQIERWVDTDGPGVYAFSRVDAEQQTEYVVAVNNSDRPHRRTLPTSAADMAFDPLWSTGQLGKTVTSDHERRVTLTVPPTGAVVYRAQARTSAPADGPSVDLSAPGSGDQVGDEVAVTADVPGGDLCQVTFAVRVGDERRRVLGTDDSPAYRVFHDTTEISAGTPITYEAVVKDSAGRIATDSVSVTKAP